jgi:hypothetical protein
MKWLNTFLHHVIGSILPRDPEEDKVLRALLDRLQNSRDWKKISNHRIMHCSHDIQIDIFWRSWELDRPERLKIPFYWRSEIKALVHVVLRNDEVDRLSFMHDVISGEYIYQIRTETYSDNHSNAISWLNENARSNQYILKNNWLYISDESVATGFKLTFG